MIFLLTLVTISRSTASVRVHKLAKTVGYYVMFISHGAILASLGPILPALALQTQTDLSTIGILFIARALGYLSGALGIGRLYDRLPGHILLVINLLLMALFISVLPLMPLLYLVLIVIFFLGLAHGLIDVGGNTLLVWVHRHKVGPFMNGLHFCFGIGAFLSPILLARVVLFTGEISWAFWMLALLILPIAAWLSYWPSPKPHVPTVDEPESAINYLLVGLVAIFFFLYVGVEAGFSGWIFSYALALNLTHETNAAYLTSTFWGMLMVGRLLTIPFTTRLKPRLVLAFALAGSLMSGLVMLAGSDNLIVVWGATVGLGFFMAPIFPTTLSLTERYTAVTGQVTGFLLFGASLGAMILPWLMGRLFEPIGPQALIYLLLAALGIAVGVFALILFQIRAKSILPET